MASRVLFSDTLSEAGLAILKGAPGLEVVYKPGLKEAELAAAIPGFDALVIRSGSKVTAKVIEAAKGLKVIGRAGIGVDTLSLDPGRSQTFDTHVTILGADRYGIENLVNLDRVPNRGATVIVGLIPWEQGSGGPARVFARW